MGNIKFWNIKNPDIAQKLIPWYIPRDENRLDIGWELHQRLKKNPDDTFCLLAMDDLVCLGVMLAYTRKNDVWCWQARGTPQCSHYSKEAFQRLMKWTREKGFDKIKIDARDERTAKCLARRYGFKPSKVRGEMVVCLTNFNSIQKK